MNVLSTLLQVMINPLGIATTSGYYSPYDYDVNNYGSFYFLSKFKIWYDNTNYGGETFVLLDSKTYIILPSSKFEDLIVWLG